MDLNKIKWAEAFDNGFRLEKVYLLINNTPPNTFRHVLGDKYIDLDNYDFSILEKHYPNAYITKQTVFSEATTSCVEDDDLPPYNEAFIDGHFESGKCIIYDDTVIYAIDPDVISIFYKDEDPKELLNKLIAILPLKEPEPKQAEVQLIAASRGDDYYTISSKIKNMELDIDKNYNDDFQPVFEDVIKFVNDRTSGLVILRGTKGSGKTSFIKYLISKFPNQYVIVTNAIAENLATPELTSFMLDHKDSIFILEDCERILMKREINQGGFGDAISNILNMSDGILSDIFNIKFICTFNADIDNIDEALLRKGRCFANYEFKELCVEKTKALLNERGIQLNSYKPMTLADIYHYNERNCDNTARRKIGF